MPSWRTLRRNEGRRPGSGHVPAEDDREGTAAVHLPPLRERREDIPVLVRHFVATHAARLRRSIATIPEPTLSALTAADWPGNIRELENVIERAVILATDGVLRVPLLGRIEAPRLGIKRTTLQSRMQKLGIVRPGY